MNSLLLNREFKLPPDDWYHVVPLGTFAHPSGAVQVIDGEATRAMVNRFNAEKAAANFPGLLVDYDHFSDSPDHSSEAAGWIDELDNRSDGIWAHIRFTPAAKQAVSEGAYRLVSPVFSRADAEALENKINPRLRVKRLLKVALTNDPNLKGMVPLSNREAPAGVPDNHNKPPKPMKSVATLLGLSAEASEEVIHAEVAKLKNRADGAEGNVSTLTTERDTLRNRNTELESEQVEQLLENRGVKADDSRHGKLKPVLAAMANRKAREDFLDEVIGKPGQPKSGTNTAPVHMRNRATPEGSFSSGEDERARANKIEAEVQSFKLANRCSYEDAFNTVRRSKPELFIRK